MNSWQDPFESHRFLSQVNLGAGTPPSQFILYNYVTDFYYYGEGIGNKTGHTFLLMRDTLIHYLTEMGVEVIAILNLSDGLRFANEAKMRPLYTRLTTPEMTRSYGGRRNETPAEASFSTATPPPSTASATSTGHAATSEPEAQTMQRNLIGLGRLLKQDHVSGAITRAAVILERIENLVTPDARPMLDQIQGWANITNGNVSFLVAGVSRQEDLPPPLAGTHRSGVRMINVGQPRKEEINHILNSAEIGWLAKDFLENKQSSIPVSPSDAALATAAASLPVKIAIDSEQRDDIIAKLNGRDILSIRALFRECAQRSVNTLTLRALHQITTRTRDTWAEALSEANLGEVKSRLRERVLGQDFAIERVIDKLRNAGQDLVWQAQVGRLEEKLLEYFFFAGPTGVGKTEIFRALQDVFQSIPARKFNMPEYKEQHSVARFFGAPPGYIGYGKGELGEFLFQNPAAIVLFDEFEKAHQEIWKNFLTMLEGSLTTGDGTRIDLSQVIFIFTSNAGAADLERIDPASGVGQQKNRDIIEKALLRSGAPPELIGRLLEAIISFNHITEPVMRKVIQLNLSLLTAQTGARFDGSVEEALMALYDQKGHLGARVIVEHMKKSLRADVSKIRPPRGLIYRDVNNVTQHIQDESQITSRFKRATTARQASTNPPVRVDPTNDKTLRTTVAPAIAAVLAFVFDAESRERIFIGAGTGFFVNETGVLITNHHVVAGATDLEVQLSGGQSRIPMMRLGDSGHYDLALLRPAQTLNGTTPYLTLANSGDVEVDTDVVTFGYPFLSYNAVTDQTTFVNPIRSERGHVGVRLEEERLFRLSGVGLNPGDSGSPLIRCVDGAIVGVVMAKRTGSEGVSYAIMSSVVQDFLLNLRVVQPFTLFSTGVL